MPDARFQPVASQMPFAQIEQDLRAFWRERRIFERSVEDEPERPLYTFYEGPPTANGVPGVHHVLARIFKDLFPRYKTMRGYRSPRKGGWDTHGLPVELEVERELGLRSKAEIEAFGIAEFNAKCRDSVFRYVQQWEDLTERTAFWLDMRDAYVTYDPAYIESCWWIIKQLWDADLIYEDRRTAPHCPRCETSLSSHELALGYQENTEDPSITVKFRVDAESLPASLREAANADTFLLAWTTTPWTLPGNTALAVATAERYVAVRDDNGERLILAEALVAAVLGKEVAVETTLTGADLLGLRYEGLYEPGDWGVRLQKFDQGRLSAWRVPAEGHAWRRVVAGEFVSMEEGTGIVHIAPAFGADDYALGRREGLVFAQPVGLDGCLTGERSPFNGLFVKQADPQIIDDLRARGYLVHATTIRHTYPFCWRCGTPLLYYAKPSWYIATTRVGDALRRSNQELIHWHPEHLRDGRYGDWIANNVDWAISRERYWGTPLPIWRCEGCNVCEAIGSFAELRTRARDRAMELPDPHRPYVDAVELDCRACGATMRRIPEVADAWFDSGAMPYAQWHYPFENQETFAERFPAEFICEGIDQTRGWFYSLHALAVLLYAARAVPEPTSYRHVLSVGHVLDEAGEKMSKSKGNVVDPWQVLAEHGADALRWYLYTVSPPGNPRRFSSALVGEAQRKFILTLWNTYSFFVTYANIDGFDPTGPLPTERAELDRWLLSALHGLIERVTAELDAYEPTNAARAIEDFVQQLSNWYVRRSRRRFWKSEDDSDKAAAYHTLYEALVTVARLTAPFIPYLSDAIYRNLVVTVDAAAPESVHLARWPDADVSRRAAALDEAMPRVQRVASLGRSARSSAGIKVRQPLHELLVSVRSDDDRETLRRYEEMLLDELNVKQLVLVEAASELVTATIKPNLPVLGPRLGREVGRLRTALQALSDTERATIAEQVAAGDTVEVAGFALSADDLLVESKPREDVAIAADGSYTVAVATTIDAELAREGTAREVVHRVQSLRRRAGFALADRIVLWLRAAGDVKEAVEAHAGYVRAETLATELQFDTLPDDAYCSEERIDGQVVTIAVRQL